MPSIGHDTRLDSPFDKKISGYIHIIEAAEGIHVMALETQSFDPGEHVAKINISFSGSHMNLIVARTIRDTDLAKARRIEPINEPVDPIRHKVGVIDSE